MTYLNLNNEKWLDLVFKDRNQNYGAYVLRKESDNITIKAFFIGSLILVGILFIFGTNLLKSNSNQVLEPILGEEFLETSFIETTPIENLVKEVPITNPEENVTEATVSKINTTAFNTIEIVDASTITKDPPTITDFIDSNPGAVTTTGSENGEIKITEPIGTSNGSVEGTSTNKIFEYVEKSAIPKNGLDKFYRDFANKFNTPLMDEGTTKVKVILSFVVEKDGSFTDIQILRDPGYGTGREAVRVLKTMEKWNPAVQNGNFVRSRFSLPILINVN